jgi:two-component system response regulator PilR (NtrC family)
MQSKLLRAIQERTVRPLGSTQEDAVDVRIVSATHKDLAAEVQAGRFRQDLYYRLNVIEILVPPLRERREDLPALCEALLARIAQESGMPVPRCRRRAGAAARGPLPAMCASSRTCCTARWRSTAKLQVDFANFAAPARGREEHVAVARRPAGLPGPAGARDPGQGAEAKPTSTAPPPRRLGLSLRQIRYRIARLNIVTPGSDDPADRRRRR